MNQRPLLLKFISFLFLVVVPINPVFSITPYTPVPMLVSILCFILFILFILQGGRFKFDTLGLLSFIILLTATISTFINVASGVELNIKHLLALYTVVLCYLIFPSYFLDTLPIERLFNALYISFVFVCLFGVFDFLMYNVLGFSVAENFLYFPDNYPVGYGVFGGLFHRNKSVFQEPGYFAWYLNTIGPILLAYASYLNLNKRFLIILILYSFSLLLSFSATGILSGIIFLAIFFLVSVRNIKVLVSASCIVLFILRWTYDIVFTIIGNKLLNNSASKVERFSRWSDGINMAFENPFFGAGIGSYSLEKGVGLASFFLKTFAELGIFTFASLCLLFSYILWKVAASTLNKSVKALLIMSLIGNTIHWGTSAPFYFTYTWLSLVIIIYLVRFNKGKHMRSTHQLA